MTEKLVSINEIDAVVNKFKEPKSLSDKRIEIKYPSGDGMGIFRYPEEDVKEFIKLLKEELANERITKIEGLDEIKTAHYLGWNDCLAQIEEMQIINKLAGIKLTGKHVNLGRN